DTVPYLFEVLLQQFGVTFDLTAVGTTSGLLAQVKFTDAVTPVALRSGSTTCIFNSSTSQTLQSGSFGTSASTLPFISTTSYDFYSGPLTRAPTIGSNDKGSGEVTVSNGAGSPSFTWNASLTFIDYNPNTGGEVTIVSSGSSPNQTTTAGNTTRVAVPT